MQCEFAREHFSALIDEELDAPLRDELDDHLQQCNQCCQEYKSLCDLDKRLSQTLLPAPVRESGIGRILEHPMEPTSRPTQLSWGQWVIGLSAIAAGICLMVFSVDPTPEAPQHTAEAHNRLPVAHLVRATGDVQVLAPGSDQWQTVPVKSSVPVQPGARIRTDPYVRCEVQTQDDCTIRMNEKAELVLHASHRCEVVRGDFACETPKSKSLRVEVPIGQGQGNNLSMDCPEESKFQWSVYAGRTTCVSQAKVAASLECGTFLCPVDPGSTVAVDTQEKVQQIDQPEKPTNVWQLPLLALRGDETPALRDELISTMRRLLAPIGLTKIKHLNETQILALGPSGALPLLAYIHDPASRGDERQRRSALRIACEIADSSAIAMLEELSDDDDDYVASLSQKTLTRLGVP